MAIGPIVTRGFGPSVGSQKFIPTHGFGALIVAEGPFCVEPFSLFLPGSKRQSVYLPGVSGAVIFLPGDAAQTTYLPGAPDERLRVYLPGDKRGSVIC